MPVRRTLLYELTQYSTIFSADCGWVFAQHFCNRLGPSYLALRNILDESNATHAEVLNDIKRRFREETFTRESIAQTIHAHPELVSTPVELHVRSLDLNGFLRRSIFYT